VSNDTTKRNEEIRDSSMPRIKPLKRPSAETDNPLVKMLDSIISGLEHSTGKRTYLCGNPDCGTLIIFHSNEQRPVVCTRCGIEIDWEGEYITRIKVCPKCNKEYDITSNYCQFHSPTISLMEKVIEK
jgi:predicted RNA-binding Zn-ribbon protein involved in translation (DUF1610 family)